ncbi:MAG: MarR family transcriptional regulator [Kofleriaceae bacterium]
MTSDVDLAALDLGYLALFVGMRVNEVLLDKLHAAGYADARHAHGYVFQHLIDGPRTITELARRLDVSQQAASKSVAELIDLGYLVSEPSPDRRARRISLSKRARACIALSRQVRARLEHKLVAKHRAAFARTRTLLATILVELGGAPAVRARQIRAPR